MAPVAGCLRHLRAKFSPWTGAEAYHKVANSTPKYQAAGCACPRTPRSASRAGGQRGRFPSSLQGNIARIRSDPRLHTPMTLNNVNILLVRHVYPLLHPSCIVIYILTQVTTPESIKYTKPRLARVPRVTYSIQRYKNHMSRTFSRRMKQRMLSIYLSQTISPHRGTQNGPARTQGNSISVT